MSLTIELCTVCVCEYMHRAAVFAAAITDQVANQGNITSLVVAKQRAYPISGNLHVSKLKLIPSTRTEQGSNMHSVQGHYIYFLTSVCSKCYN